MTAGLVTRAETLARQAHAGQVDKQGRDYAEFHLRPVAALLAPFGPEAEAAGWLHDAFEDTELDPSALEEEGIPASVSAAVISVTRWPDETYRQLIDRAAAHPIGRYVKLMDNWVNLTGLDGIPDEATRDRLRSRYEAARVVLLIACGLEVTR